MRLIQGLWAFITDCWRFFIWMINRPLAVIFFIALFFAGFAFFGIYPLDIPNWFNKKLKPEVCQRIADLKLNARKVSKVVNKKSFGSGKTVTTNTQLIPQNIEEEMILRDLKIPVYKADTVSNSIGEKAKTQQQNSQEKIWKDVIKQQQPDPFEFVNPKDIIEGQIFVLSADTIKIGEKVIKLNVKLRGGKAKLAFIALKQNYEGQIAKCILPVKECFVGYNNVSQTLLDQGLAD